MSENDDWDYEPSEDNAPSVLEMVQGVIGFTVTAFAAFAAVIVPVGIAAFFVWLVLKLTIFLMGA